jgi:hypothetical protein
VSAVRYSSAALASGAIVSIREVKEIVLSVAPGEPDDPRRARSFLLSWWEKEPPWARGQAGFTSIRRPGGWYFITKRLGAEGRLLIVGDGESGPLLNADQSERLYTAMFGPLYAVRHLEEANA